MLESGADTQIWFFPPGTISLKTGAQYLAGDRPCLSTLTPDVLIAYMQLRQVIVVHAKHAILKPVRIANGRSRLKTSAAMRHGGQADSGMNIRSLYAYPVGIKQIINGKAAVLFTQTETACVEQFM